MSRSSKLLCVGLLVLLGCSRQGPTATKEIQVPGGGAPVLTTTERERAAKNTAAKNTAANNTAANNIAARNAFERDTAVPNTAALNTTERAAREAQQRQPGAISQASYQQPAESPLQSQALKPFEQWSDQETAEVAL